jgi:hypothetical protein
MCVAEFYVVEEDVVPLYLPCSGFRPLVGAFQATPARASVPAE